MTKSKPKLVGILNVTPDSYVAASRRLDPAEAVARGLQLEAEGADILDIGGESTRPKNFYTSMEYVEVEEELARVILVIKELSKKLRIPISIDTIKPRVAAEAIKAGASIINDITGLRDPEMVEVAVAHDVEVWVTHMLGEPKTMQVNPHYENGVVNDLIDWFTKRTKILLDRGIKRERIVIDPGIGFGKTVADNLEIIHNLARFRSLGFSVLLGVSRKSFMAKILNKPAEELLAATIAMNTTALPHLDYIRVHDVKEHRDVIDLLEAMKR